jgi:hypothetical protein
MIATGPVEEMIAATSAARGLKRIVMVSFLCV